MLEAKEKLTAALAKLKLAKDLADLPKHKVWIPEPEKAKAKLLGIKWNDSEKSYELASNDPDSHPGAKYLPKNFAQLTGKVPYAQRQEFKDLGVVSQLQDGVWVNYVMMHEDYADLLAGLTELELL